MTLDETLLPDAEAARERLLEAEHRLDRARVDFHHEIRRLNAAGGSLREIADRFGLSHQRVHQIVDAGGEGGRPGRKALLIDRIKSQVRDWGGFTRFTRGAREVVRRAQEEAGRLGHGDIGTEHLLLALMQGAEDDDLAARVLDQAGITLEAAREEVLRHRTGGEARADADSLRFTAGAKKVLELSLREAMVLKHDHIGTEHILLGLLRESSGLGARVLGELGAQPAALRARVKALL